MKVAIIGGGPIGLAAAAHLAEHNIDFEIFEAGNNIGHNILSWGHVQLFSPWRYNMDQAAIRLLTKANWSSPVLDDLHTGSELVENYLTPLANHPDIKPQMHLNSKVISISKRGFDKMKTSNRGQVPFELRIDKEGTLSLAHADVILDATGTWSSPNPIGSNGLLADGEIEAFKHITKGIPDIKGKDAAKFINQTSLVVGSGHSAINTLLDFAELQKSNPKTKLHWVLRKKNLAKVYGGQDKDGFEARGTLSIKLQQLVESKKIIVHTPFLIQKIERTENGLTITGLNDNMEDKIIGINHIISNTGSRPNVEIFKELRVDLDSSLESVFDLAPLIDPNIHSCGTVRPHGEKELRHPEKNFYIVGSKSYGRAPTFLMATGYEQLRSIVAYLVGDFEAALRTELELPETGVCSADFDDEEVCCAPSQTEISLCC